MKRYTAIFLMLLAASVCAQEVPTLDESARFLAGLEVKGALEPLTRTDIWQKHAASMNEAWFRKEALQLGPINAWMNANASEYYISSNTMYYMFGGPDFLYAHAFFPYASTYILAGLEPVGQVPDVSRRSPAMVGGDLDALRASMRTILQTHYFVTKDMRAELGLSNLGGTVPILYVFLARRGCTVLDTTYVKTPAEGVKINFRNGIEGRTQTLYYFKTDLSGGKSKFLTWCAAQGPGLSLLKAASFLMHGEGFAGVRDFLLSRSRVIIQDDSGIPLRSFPKGWNVNYYGRYVPHAETFRKFNQADLAAIYENNPPPSELGFAFGYHWQPERGILMMATRK